MATLSCEINPHNFNRWWLNSRWIVETTEAYLRWMSASISTPSIQTYTDAIDWSVSRRLAVNNGNIDTVLRSSGVKLVNERHDLVAHTLTLNAHWMHQSTDWIDFQMNQVKLVGSMLSTCREVGVDWLWGYSIRGECLTGIVGAISFDLRFCCECSVVSWRCGC